MSLQAFLTWPRATFVVRDRRVSYFTSLLQPLNLFELSQALNQPLSPITSLEDLQQKTDHTLQSLEQAFEKASECCSHLTIGGLFGSTPIAYYLEKLLPRNQENCESKSPANIERFSHSFAAEIIVSLALNFLGLMDSLTPVIAVLSLVSTSFLETVIQHFFKVISLQSFAILTDLIRQRLTEYTEFKSFVSEYSTYTAFFATHHHKASAAWQIPSSTDPLTIFKMIYLFDRTQDRRLLLQKLLKILQNDQVFRSRLQKKLPQLGFVFLRTLEML